MESSKIIKQIISDENLSLIGVIVAVLGFYVIVEWQMIIGFLIVTSAYGLIITSTSTIRKFVQFLFLKLKTLIGKFSAS